MMSPTRLLSLCALSLCALSCADGDDVAAGETLVETQLSSTLKVSARGASMSSARRVGALRGVLPTLGAAEAFVVPLHMRSLDARVDLQSSSCERALVIFELSQRPLHISARARPYLEALPVNAQELSAALTGLSFSLDPNEPRWDPLGGVQELPLRGAGAVSRWGVLISRAERLARPLSDEELRRVEEALAGADVSPSAPPATPPCSEAFSLEGATPLSLVTRLRAPRRSSDALTLAVVSDLRAGDARLDALISSLNAAQVDAVVLNGGLLSTTSGVTPAARAARLSALERVWLALPSAADLRDAGDGEWARLFGDRYALIEAGDVRLVALSVSEPFDDESRQQVSRWSGDAPLVWRGAPAPLRRLLLTPRPLSPSGQRDPVESRSALMRFLDEVSASGFTRLFTVGAQEPHHALKGAPLPSFSSTGEWAELRLSTRCAAEIAEMAETPETPETPECWTLTRRAP